MTLQSCVLYLRIITLVYLLILFYIKRFFMTQVCRHLQALMAWAVSTHIWTTNWDIIFAT